MWIWVGGSAAWEAPLSPTRMARCTLPSNGSALRSSNLRCQLTADWSVHSQSDNLSLPKMPGRAALVAPLVIVKRVNCRVQIGNQSPDVDPADLSSAWEVTQRLLRQRAISSGHDISDGGIAAALLEMAFASNAGIQVSASQAATQKRTGNTFLAGRAVGGLPEWSVGGSSTPRSPRRRGLPATGRLGGTVTIGGGLLGGSVL